MPHGMAPLAWVNQTPRVWLLMGQKAGDNSQVLALAEALGWPFETKRFVYNRFEPMAHAFIGATLAGLDKSKSTPLSAPWPDLVLTAGRRNEPVARWIKKQATHHNVRVVHVGRPWSKLHHFDLVVTTPQYRLPKLDNIVHNKTPLHRVTLERMNDEAAAWAPRLEHLPKPHIAVILGGSSGPYNFDRLAAKRLAEQANAFARRQGGSLLVTTSARTSTAAVDVLEKNLDVPRFFFKWAKDATENPYFAFLGLADELIVTGDSMSMLTEACFTRKPVYIFDLGEGRNAMRSGISSSDPRPWREFEFSQLRGFLYSQLMRFGPIRLSRDIRIIHQDLVAAKRAAWLGETFLIDHRPPPLDCIDHAVAGVRQLFDLPPVPAYGSIPFAVPQEEPLRRSA